MHLDVMFHVGSASPKEEIIKDLDHILETKKNPNFQRSHCQCIFNGFLIPYLC